MTHIVAGLVSSISWHLVWSFLTSDVGLGLVTLILFVLVIRPLWKRSWRARQIIRAANDVFNEVEAWAERENVKGDWKLYRFLKLLSDRVDGLTAEEAELAKKWAAAQAANHQ